MRGKPQSSQLNVLMAPCAGMALFLASVVLLDQSVGRLAADWSGGRSLQLAAPITLCSLLRAALSTATDVTDQPVRAGRRRARR